MSFEPMPIPIQGDKDFPGWLVPARNNIQRQLLRLQNLLGQPSKNEPPPPVPIDSDEGWVLGWLLGVGFSLWRAVFQAGENLERDRNFEAGRKFLDDIIRNNAAAYRDELNSWSLGYYLSNARFRLIPAHKSLKRLMSASETVELDALISRIEEGFEAAPGPAPNEWMLCFHAMRLMLDALEQHRRGA
jgi:hypothetical protein